MKFSIIIGMLFAKSAVGQQEVPCTSNDIVVFGDSFSDTGNMFEMTMGTVPPGPPYYAFPEQRKVDCACPDGEQHL